MTITAACVSVIVLLFIVVYVIITAYQDYEDRQKKLKQDDWYYNLSAYMPEREYNVLLASNCGKWYYDVEKQDIFCYLEDTTKWHRNYKIEVFTSGELKKCSQTNLKWFQQDGKYYIAIYAWKTAETEASYQAALQDRVFYEKDHPEVKRNRLLQEQNNLMQQHQKALENQLENIQHSIRCVAAINLLNGINRR